MKRGVPVLKHILFVCTVLFLLLGLPLLRSPVFRARINGTDAITGATTVLDAPGGEYLVLINRAKHEAGGTLDTWKTFFEGGDIGVVFEDLDCLVIRGDTGGLEAAKSYQSRLPENQMKVRPEDGILTLSKAEYGKYDIIVMSAEAAGAYGADALADHTQTLMVRVRQ